MKIGITTFGCDGGRSGIGQYTIQLLRQFAEMQTDAQFEVIVHEDEREVFVPTTGTGMEALVLPASLRQTARNLVWHQHALPRLCRERGYDALFLPAGNRRLPWSSPCPTIGTVHDFASLHVAGKYDLVHMLYIKRILPALTRRLTRVIAVSEAGKRDILNYAHVPKEKVQVISEAADTTAFFPRDAAAARAQVGSKYGIRGSYLLYVSRIEHPGKNHMGLIRAYERLRDAGELQNRQLVFAGSDWPGAEPVHQEAERSRYAADICFTGFVDKADLPSLYAGADVFVFPSLYEGFGIPLLEAMASGVPVVCANVASLPEVAGDAALMVDPNDDAAMAAAILRLMQDTGCYERYRQAGLARAAVQLAGGGGANPAPDTERGVIRIAN